MSINTLAARVQALGGDQLGRIKRQKLESFRWALKNDYQTRMIKTPIHGVWPALINNNEAGLKSDYDKKIVSVEFNSGLEAGDVFECLDDGTHWMIYLPVLTETAYLRAEIVRCRYTLTIGDETYWIYFQGPTETDLRWFQKQGINMNELNLSGTIYIKLNEKTRAFFERFTHIEVDNHIWEVQVTDSISTPGVLELEVQEYYDNTPAELPEIKKYESPIIYGKTTVAQDTTEGYYIIDEYYDPKRKWKVVGNERVRLTDTFMDGKMCNVRIYDGAIGNYTIQYGDESLECTIDWQRDYIQGPKEIYPYDTYVFKALYDGVTFSVDSDLVKIESQDGQTCRIYVDTGKKGSFNLSCENSDGEVFTLPVKIGSWFGGKGESEVGRVS